MKIRYWSFIGVLFVLSLFFVTSFSSAQSSYALVVTLTLNNSRNTVFVPYVGAAPASTLPTATYASPPHFYLASYSNNRLFGVIYSQQAPQSISTATSGSNHVLTLKQRLDGSQAFLTDTAGDYRQVEGRMQSIERLGFLTQITPAFAYPPGTKYPVRILLNYTDIDIIGSLIFQSGTHELSINNTNSPIPGKVALNFAETFQP